MKSTCRFKFKYSPFIWFICVFETAHAQNKPNYIFSILKKVDCMQSWSVPFMSNINLHTIQKWCTINLVNCEPSHMLEISSQYTFVYIELMNVNNWFVFVFVLVFATFFLEGKKLWIIHDLLLIRTICVSIFTATYFPTTQTGEKEGRKISAMIKNSAAVSLINACITCTIEHRRLSDTAKQIIGARSHCCCVRFFFFVVFILFPIIVWNVRI